MFDVNVAAVHGGTDALGVPAHDFSTNRNACGPCPMAVRALQAAHVAQYPDPHYTDLRAQLAHFHGVAVERILIGGSSSELIHRLTLHAVRSGAKSVQFPQHHYGDYLQAARVWRLALSCRAEAALPPTLSWACEPSSPLGAMEDIWPAWQQAPAQKEWRVLDCAYRPLWLEGDAPARPLDFVSLAALADTFLVRIMLVRGTFQPMATVSMTTYFHVGAEELARIGAAPVLGDANCDVFHDCFADQTCALWSEDGRLLANGVQITWYKE